jgi:AraC family transcriptional regulator, regulatory protein of adaptative response / methylated-DNA-[protein]-cysteine methyltransferase
LGFKKFKSKILLYKINKKMSIQQSINYNRIAAAIKYIETHFKDQPNLDEVAANVHLSPFHFQKLFTDWAGVSPKKFLQYISIQYAKNILKDKQATLFDAAFETGLSGTGRLHDLFVKIEGMTPGEFKNGGEHLCINYSYAETPFGNIVVASTTKGICYMAFADDEQQALIDLQQYFPKANFKQILDTIQQNALYIFTQDWAKLPQIKLHLKGTNFQLKVWETLLKIPIGQLSTYGDIATQIKNPKAARAVGTAIGSNPVAFLIPCHRVIQATGTLGGYMWGPIRKTAIIGWEAAKIQLENK